MGRKELNHLISHALANAMYNVDEDLHPTDAHGIAGKLIKNDKSVKKLIEYIDQLEAERKWLKREDESWSLIAVLKKLIMSADILLIKKDYDGRYHEEIKTSRDIAELILNNLNKQK